MANPRPRASAECRAGAKHRIVTSPGVYMGRGFLRVHGKPSKSEKFAGLIRLKGRRHRAHACLSAAAAA